MKTARMLPLLLASLLTAGSVHAAEPAEAPAVETADADAAATTDAERDAALEEEIRAADEAAVSDATPAPAGRNESFIPTVQISEDLSVSFPVDI